MDTDVISDVLFTPTMKATHVRFRELAQHKAVTKKPTISHQKKTGLGTDCVVLPSSLFYSLVCSVGTAQCELSGLLLLPLGVVSSLPPVIKFDVDLISYYLFILFLLLTLLQTSPSSHPWLPSPSPYPPSLWPPPHCRLCLSVS